ncbi:MULTISPECIES: hypothetical protein [unclassified Streptomyces]|uniref:hypothetical protein n=1 Tax=unclassified Streptomyces TaxID=2593676 RepID=UPI0007C84F5C|nr:MULTISPECIES: hypothetical protein [unclassified Streptomyces]
MAEVAFRPLQSWALPPEKPRTDRGTARAERDTYRDSFRYLRIPRLPADCPPWVLGQELGWAVRSPVTLTMKPLDDIGIAVPEREDAHQAGRRLGGAGMWQRGEEWIAARNADWLHLGDYRAANGSWEGMFLPNGQGTVEWRLGWAATIPARTFLMVMPPPGSGPDGLRVPLGVIPAKSVNAMADRGGMSIAVEPERPVTIQRGQEIARIVLLHPDSLRASTHQHPTEPESSIPPPEHPAEAAGHGQETGR